MTVSPSDRQSLRKQATRLRILEAAEELFAELGADQTTIQQVAAMADVSPATIYQHFASKTDLYLAVAERALSQHELEMAEAWSLDGSPVDRLIGAAGAYVRFTVRHPFLFRLVALPATSQRTEDDMGAVTSMTAERVERLTGSLADAISHAIEQGALKPVDPALFSRFVWGSLSGVLGFAARRGARREDEQQVRDALIEGLSWLLEGVLTDDYRGDDGRVTAAVQENLKAVLQGALP